MARRILIDKEHSKTGFTLVQEDNDVYVLSACCESRLSDFSKRCVDCNDVMVEDPGGTSWSVNWRVDHALSESLDQWVEWLKFWFGLENAEVKIDVGS